MSYEYLHEQLVMIYPNIKNNQHAKIMINVVPTLSRSTKCITFLSKPEAKAEKGNRTNLIIIKAK